MGKYFVVDQEGIQFFLYKTYLTLVSPFCDRFGHTPLEEAKSVNNTAVVKYLEKFQQEKGALKPRQQNYAMMPGTGAASCSEKELKTSVVALSERVEYLESLLKEVSKIGVALKESPNTNGTDVEKLAEKLAAMKPESSEKENSRR